MSSTGISNTKHDHHYYSTIFVSTAASLSRTIKEELGRRNPYHPYLPTIYIITPTFPRQEQVSDKVLENKSC